MAFRTLLFLLSIIMVLLLQSFITVTIFMSIHQPRRGLKPLGKSVNINNNQRLDIRKYDKPGFSNEWNITGTYKGYWRLLNPTNCSSRFPYFWKSNGSFTFDLITTPTNENNVHSIKGVLNFNDMFNNENKEGNVQVRVKGQFNWPYKQLQVRVNSDKDGGDEDGYILLHPYHVLGVYASRVFQESFRNHSSFYNMKDDNIGIRAQLSKDADHDHFNMKGLIESPLVDDNGDSFPAILLNATYVETGNYLIKAIKYILMVIFISLFEICLLILQLQHSDTRVGAASVSIFTISHQAIMDTYVSLLHVIAGYLVEPLFNWCMVAAIFKSVLFSFYEMRYILVIWHANRPVNDGRSWVALMVAISAFRRNFYIILIGGIPIMYTLRKFLPVILFILHSFWIPQIVTNIVRNTRKPVHPLYILGMSITRLSIPLYIFGCPHNFIHAKTQKTWSISLAVFMALQTSILLVQNYFGSRCFLPDQIFPSSYSYYRRFNHNVRDGPECVICISTIDISWRSDDYMATPCNHFFHWRCLQRWMDVKMECPTCRRPLPEP